LTPKKIRSKLETFGVAGSAENGDFCPSDFAQIFSSGNVANFWQRTTLPIKLI
jgi:hypothetical protein